MCRSKGLGGRRCPSHADPVKHAAYNAHRRKLYALKKKKTQETLVSNPSSDYLHLFPEVDAVRPAFEGEALEKFMADAQNFAAKLIPGYDPAEAEEKVWRVNHDYYSRKLEKNESILFYTGGYYQAVRDYLNGKQMNEGHDTSSFTEGRENWYAENTKTMDEALALADEPLEPRLVYRGVKINQKFTSSQVDEFIEENFPVGGIISQKSYMSTSASAYVASSFSEVYTARSVEDFKKSVVLEILTKKGAPLTYGTSHFGEDESEVLLPRETKLRVLSVHRQVNFSTKVEEEGIVTNSRTVIRLVDADDENEEN